MPGVSSGAIPGEGLFAFAGRRVLLLQGPVGPFFNRLGRDLRWAGATVHKVNFNGGDWLFDRHRSTNFRGPLRDWAPFLQTLIRERRIDAVMLYGDCRPIHAAARTVAEAAGIDLFVFEEGYVRPDYVTFERSGVNGHSRAPRSPLFYLNLDIDETLPTPDPVGSAFWTAAGWAVLYYLAAFLLRPLFRHVHHHRALSLLDSFPWCVSLGRKLFYGWVERHELARLTGAGAAPFFLVPLQVFNDAQVTVHSQQRTVIRFIETVAASFAAHAPRDARLVFKHHPMDRGYVDYSHLLARVALRHGLEGRIAYIHDQHLPTLLVAARGLVTINSTVGMSALLHEVPTITLGNAYYDFAGLTWQRGLDSFWAAAEGCEVNMTLFRRFRAFLIRHTQVNGNFYRRLPASAMATGMRWNAADRAPLGRAMPQVEDRRLAG